MAYDVFISYSRKDKTVADQLCAALDAAGMNGRYWIDRSINGSANFLTEIVANIQSCKVVIFIASASSALSEWTQKELLYANKKGKKILTYKISDFSFDDNAELDFFFTNVQWLEDLDRVVADCCKLCGCTPQTKLDEERIKQEEAERKKREEEAERERIRKEAESKKRKAEEAERLKREAEEAERKRRETESRIKQEEERQKREEEAAARKRQEQEERKRLDAKMAELRGEDERRMAAGVFKVGDYYNDTGDCFNRAGKKGVVFEVTPDGRHGKIVSVDQMELCWSIDKRYGGVLGMGGSNPSEERTGAADKANGAENQKAVEKLGNWREKYPAFDWCARSGSGWYLPAVGELERILLDDATLEAVNRTLQEQGWKPMLDKTFTGWTGGYWSSTERSGNEAWIVKMGGSKQYGGTSEADTSNKYYKYFVRAVCKF